MNIGLVGRRRSGKDTIAQYLCETHGYTRAAFADGVRDAALAIDPYIEACSNEDGDPNCVTTRLSDVVRRWGWERAKDEWPEVRRLLQCIGDEAGRRIHGEDTWVQRTLRVVRDTRGPCVVSDVRYPNEAEALRSVGFVLLRVTRPGMVTTEHDEHSSEQMFDFIPTDADICNDGEPWALFASVENAISQLLGVK